MAPLGLVSFTEAGYVRFNIRQAKSQVSPLNNVQPISQLRFQVAKMEIFTQ
jgi:hypothetical protein